MPPADPAARALAAGQLSSALRAVFSVTMISRVGGLLRDVVIARLFGNTALGSAFMFAFAIPNTFRRLFGEGALSAAFIPEYTKALRDDPPDPNNPTSTSAPRDADRFASATIAVLGLITSLITIVGVAIFLALAAFLPHDPERALSFRLVAVILPFMPLICIAAILAGMLQVHGRFAAASSGPILLNAFIIAVGVYYLFTKTPPGAATAYALAIATVLSGLTQSLWFARLLRPYARWTSAVRQAAPRLRVLLRRFVPVAIGLGAVQLSTLADNVLAMWPIWVGPTVLGHPYPLDRDSNILLALTQRLYQFPLGVFGVAVATAAFPLLARAASDPSNFAHMLRRAIRLSVFIGLPASAGLALVRVDAITVLFGGSPSPSSTSPMAGGFDADGLTRSASILLGYACAIWAFSLNQIFTRAFYARGDTRTPMTIALFAVGLNLVLNVVLMFPLKEAGLAWATASSSIIQCVILARLSRTRLGLTPIDSETLRAIARIAGATLAMGIAVVALHAVFPTPAGWLAHTFRLAASLLVGGSVFLMAAIVLKTPELRWLVSRSAR